MKMRGETSLLKARESVSGTVDGSSLVLHQLKAGMHEAGGRFGAPHMHRYVSQHQIFPSPTGYFSNSMHILMRGDDPRELLCLQWHRVDGLMCACSCR